MEFKPTRNKDLRKYSIMPIKAVQDQRINKTRAISVLAAICSYVDETGVTYVSQARLAKDLDVSRQAINRQVRQLHKLGYLVYAKKRYKDQKTTSIKVIYDPEVIDETTARALLSPKEQMDLAEREALAGLAGETSGVSGEKGQVQPNRVSGGETSDVAGGETSSVAQNRLLNRQDNDIKGDVRRMTSLFTRAADKMGQPRVLNARDFEVMEGWLRQGLIQPQWELILSSHVAYCKDERREIARSLGYFIEPVKKMLSKSSSPKVQGMVKDLAKSMRLK